MKQKQKCPFCRGELLTTRTYKKSENIRYRYGKCLECGRRWKTIVKTSIVKIEPVVHFRQRLAVKPPANT